MKIAVLLSGGVDSSVALRLLQGEGGHDLHAYYLKVWLEDEVVLAGDCPWEEDVRYVRAVCDQLDIPLDMVPLQSEYLENVVSYVLAELKAGRTPSPDVLCNQHIKFGAFLDVVADCDRVASGHYARVAPGDTGHVLKRAADPAKDQTYFLASIDQQQLARMLFPIGHLHKHEVRELASRFGLPTKDRKDSQGICFLGKIDYRDFVELHLGRSEGEIRDRDRDCELGRHNGYWFYTIGQRFGLGLAGGPWYVVAKDIDRNIIYVSHRDRDEARQRHRFCVDRINWIAGEPRRAELQCKLRHGPELTRCVLDLQTHPPGVTLERPDPGIASGQFAVFYDGDVCLGGGVIV